MAEQAGCRPLLSTLENGLVETFDAVAYFGDGAGLKAVRSALAARSGPIVPLLTAVDQAGLLLLERHVCIDTTAAGGNASLMSQAS
ncbi:hypothetical protein [Devosia aurantiaca]|nr:hypothetical protein [Devosia aurantiaca]